RQAFGCASPLALWPEALILAPTPVWCPPFRVFGRRRHPKGMATKRRELDIMRIAALWLMLCAGSGAAQAQVELIPDKEPQRVFAGEGRKVALIWRNQSDKSVSVELRTRLHQASS